MTRSPAHTGPFTRRIFYSEQQIERICSSALESVNLLPLKPEPIRIDRFIQLYFNIEEDYEALDPGIMGCAVFTRQGLSKILISRILSEDSTTSGQRRLRSTLAHEAAHGLLHKDLHIEKLARDSSMESFTELGPEYQSVREDGFQCRAELDLEKNSSANSFEWWEYQANLGMASLLLPLSLVLPFAREQLEDTFIRPEEFPGRIKEIENKVSDLFHVRRKMVEIRLRRYWQTLREQPTLF